MSTVKKPSHIKQCEQLLLSNHTWMGATETNKMRPVPVWDTLTRDNHALKATVYLSLTPPTLVSLLFYVWPKAGRQSCPPAFVYFWSESGFPCLVYRDLNATAYRDI